MVFFGTLSVGIGVISTAYHSPREAKLRRAGFRG
jgi:hypothetical protein